VNNRTSTTALITGASSGIGAVFARRLAARGKNLILVARRQEKLAALARELEQRYSIAVEILLADLSQPDDIEKVEKRIQELDNLDMLINNAGFGTGGKFVEVELDKQLSMIEVHIVATMRLCRAALPAMLARGRGSIINVSSISAFLPVAGSVNYSASKVYLVNFSKALQAELAGTSIKVQALCPGFTYTEFHSTSEYQDFDRGHIPRGFWMSGEAVVNASLRDLARNRTVCIPGFINHVMIALAGNDAVSPIVRAVVKRFRG